MAVADHVTGPEQARTGSRLRVDRILRHMAIFLGLVLLWEIGARSGWLNPLFFPGPPRSCGPST
jgi:NitT/TauT family transport system permease protein